MNNELEQLKREVAELRDWKKSMESSYSIGLKFDQAMQGRGFVKGPPGVAVYPVTIGGTGASSLTGILKGNGTSPFTAIVPIAGAATYYVALSPGGATNTAITFTDGILTAEV